jgi:AcrR family transcriptional regulator
MGTKIVSRLSSGLTESRREQQRQRILAYASERFFQEGFLRFSVDRIAADLQMSKKTFYEVFPSKKTLVEQVIEQQLEEIRKNLDAILRRDSSFVEKFHLVMRFMASVGGKIGHRFLQDLQRQSPELWDRIQRFRRERITQNFSKLLNQGLHEGHIRQAINTQIFLQSYLAAVDAVINPAVLMHQPFSAQEAMRGLLEIFFRGVLTSEATRKLARFQDQQTHNQHEEFQ